jgi:hypothetical protein
MLELKLPTARRAVLDLLSNLLEEVFHCTHLDRGERALTSLWFFTFLKEDAERRRSSLESFSRALETKLVVH